MAFSPRPPAGGFVRPPGQTTELEITGPGQTPIRTVPNIDTGRGQTPPGYTYPPPPTLESTSPSVMRSPVLNSRSSHQEEARFRPPIMYSPSEVALAASY